MPLKVKVAVFVEEFQAGSLVAMLAGLRLRLAQIRLTPKTRVVREGRVLLRRTVRMPFLGVVNFQPCLSRTRMRWVHAHGLPIRVSGPVRLATSVFACL